MNISIKCPQSVTERTTRAFQLKCNWFPSLCKKTPVSIPIHSHFHFYITGVYLTFETEVKDGWRQLMSI